MERVWVVGNSGSGKTTVARAIAGASGSPHMELDAVFHQPGWTELPVEEFRARVGAFVAAERWVVDGNYAAVADLVWRTADTVVWIDLPRRVVMRRLARRTLSRALRRTELWNGNREPLRNFTSLKPERSILVWAWTRHDLYRSRYEEAMVSGAWPRVRFERLRSRRAVEEFVRGVGGGAGG